MEYIVENIMENAAENVMENNELENIAKKIKNVAVIENAAM